MDRDSQSELRFVKAATPFILGGLCLIAVLTNGGLFGGALVLVAFLLGWMVAEGRLPFGKTLEQRRELGREGLRKLAPEALEDVHATLKDGRKLEAIKMVRAQTMAGLEEAKEAVEVLEAFGDDWATDASRSQE